MKLKIKLIVLMFVVLFVILPFVYAYDSGWLRVTDGLTKGDVEGCQFGAANCNCLINKGWWATDCNNYMPQDDPDTPRFVIGIENNPGIFFSNTVSVVAGEVFINGSVNVARGISESISSFTYRVPHDYMSKSGFTEGDYYISIDGRYSGSGQKNEFINVSVSNDGGKTFGASQLSIDLNDVSDKEVWQSCYFPEKFHLKTEKSVNKVKFKGSSEGASESVHLDAFRISSEIPKHSDGTLLVPCIGKPGNDPIIESVSHRPEPAEVSRTITFSVKWKDDDSSKVSLKICKGNSSDDIYCVKSGIWCEAAVSSDNPINCTYIAQEKDIGKNKYYAKIWDDSGRQSYFSREYIFTVKKAEIPSNNPPTAILNADQTEGVVPLSVNFTGGCFDAEDGELKGENCLIFYGDSPGIFVFENGTVHRFNSAGAYTVKLTAKDSKGAIADKSIIINVNQLPIVTQIEVCENYTKKGDCEDDELLIAKKEGNLIPDYGFCGKHTWKIGSINCENETTCQCVWNEGKCYLSKKLDIELDNACYLHGTPSDGSSGVFGNCKNIYSSKVEEIANKPGYKNFSWTRTSIYTWDDGNGEHLCSDGCDIGEEYCSFDAAAVGVCTPNSCKSGSGSIIIKIALLPFFTLINLMIAAIVIAIYNVISHKKKQHK